MRIKTIKQVYSRVYKLSEELTQTLAKMDKPVKMEGYTSRDFDIIIEALHLQNSIYEQYVRFEKGIRK